MERRLKGLKEKGVIAADINLPNYPELQYWNELNEEE